MRSVNLRVVQAKVPMLDESTLLHPRRTRPPKQRQERKAEPPKSDTALVSPPYDGYDEYLSLVGQDMAPFHSLVEEFGPREHAPAFAILQEELDPPWRDRSALDRGKRQRKENRLVQLERSEEDT